MQRMGLTLTTEGRVLHCGSMPDENVVALGELGKMYKLPPEKALILAAKLIHSVAALDVGAPITIDRNDTRFLYEMEENFDEAVRLIHKLYNGGTA